MIYTEQVPEIVRGRNYDQGLGALKKSADRLASAGRSPKAEQQRYWFLTGCPAFSAPSRRSSAAAAIVARAGRGRLCPLFRRPGAAERAAQPGCGNPVRHSPLRSRR